MYISKDIRKYFSEFYSENFINDILRFLELPPLFSTLRINTQNISVDEACVLLRKEFENERCSFSCFPHPILKDLVVVEGKKATVPIQKEREEVVVDNLCGIAVLRGAEVFAQGVLGMTSGVRGTDTMVSVYADTRGTCRKGFAEIFHGPDTQKVFLGNGRALMNRHMLFSSKEVPSGVAVSMETPLYFSPKLNNLLSGLLFPQNLPSVVCGHVLNPVAGDHVLDMCAAPGGKTCHLGVLMENKGLLIAIDRVKSKISRVKATCEAWHLSNVHVYCADSTNIFLHDGSDLVSSFAPPFAFQVFDKVLLDAPCSALGQRPCFGIHKTVKELRSHVVVQRKLLSQAVLGLKTNGVLVYSTCTFARAECEDNVIWFLKKFPCMRLEPQTPHLGGKGISGDHSIDCLLQRFDGFKNDEAHLSSSEESDLWGRVHSDTILFFIARFRKVENMLPCKV